MLYSRRCQLSVTVENQEKVNNLQIVYAVAEFFSLFCF